MLVKQLISYVLYLLLAYVLQISALTLYNSDKIVKINNKLKLVDDKAAAKVLQSASEKTETIESPPIHHHIDLASSAGNLHDFHHFPVPEFHTNHIGGHHQQQLFSPIVPYWSHSPFQQAPQFNEIYTTVSKDVYTFAAPDEVHEISLNPSSSADHKHKNYKVLFIKAPSHEIRLNAESMQHIQNSNEEKTIVYVLSKQPNLHHVEYQLQFAHSNKNKKQKPEVYFVKYRTDEEGEYAKRLLESQHFGAGGISQDHQQHHQFVAPVSNVGNLHESASGWHQSHHPSILSSQQHNHIDTHSHLAKRQSDNNSNNIKPPITNQLLPPRPK